MRLNQLARKLHVEPEALVAELGKNGVQVENQPNTKLEADHVSMLEEQFKVEEPVEEAVEEESVVKAEIVISSEDIPEPETESELEVVEAAKEDEPTEAVVEAESEDSNEEVKERVVEAEAEIEEEKISEPEEVVEAEESSVATIQDILEEGKSIEDVDLIKAPKVTLPGIKVVGKIDLPEKPEPEVEEVVVEAAVEEVLVEEEEDDGVHKNKKARVSKEALKQTQKEVADRAKQKRKEEEKKEKERKQREKQREERKKKRQEENQEVEEDLSWGDTTKKGRVKRNGDYIPAWQKGADEEVNSRSAGAAPSKKKKSKQVAPEPKGFWAKFKFWLFDQGGEHQK